MKFDNTDMPEENESHGLDTQRKFKARTFNEIKKSMIEYVQQNYPKIYKDSRTPEEMERDFLIMEIAKLKQEIEIIKQHK